MARYKQQQDGAAVRKSSKTLDGIRKLNVKMKRLDAASDRAIADQMRLAASVNKKQNPLTATGGVG